MDDAMRLEPGDIVRTSYNTGPFIIKEVQRGCTCPEYIDEINGLDRRTKEHVHIVCIKQDGYGESYLNYYDEDTLQSVVSDDYLILVSTGKLIQMTMF